MPSKSALFGCTRSRPFCPPASARVTEAGDAVTKTGLVSESVALLSVRGACCRCGEGPGSVLITAGRTAGCYGLLLRPVSRKLHRRTLDRRIRRLRRPPAQAPLTPVPVPADDSDVHAPTCEEHGGTLKHASGLSTPCTVSFIPIEAVPPPLPAQTRVRAHPTVRLSRASPCSDLRHIHEFSAELRGGSGGLSQPEKQQPASRTAHPCPSPRRRREKRTRAARVRGSLVNRDLWKRTVQATSSGSQPACRDRRARRSAAPCPLGRGRGATCTWM